MNVFVEVLWAVCPAILTGIVLSVWNSKQNKRDVSRDKIYANREESETLKLSLLLATAQLSRAVAIAIKRGYPNGEIEEGLAQYNETIKKFRDFEREQLAKINEK